MTFWIAPLLVKRLHGPSVALALLMIQLIDEVLQRVSLADAARATYARLPATWHAPVGPTTEAEWLQVIQCGVDFYTALRRCMTP